MAGKRKTPGLRLKDGCYVTDIYRTDGKRSTVSFGSPGPRTVGDIYATFGKWLDLFNQHPHKMLEFRDPYDAIDKMVNPATILSVGELYDKYVAWAKQYLPPLRDDRPNPDLVKVERLAKFLEPYRSWPIADFGPEELLAIQKAMVEYRYFRTNHPNEPIPYTRSGINQLVNQIHKVWHWGVGREAVTLAQAHRLREVKSLRIGRTAAIDKIKRAAVTEEDFEKSLSKVNSVVADMLRLIWLTAMRPGEVCRMRPIDIDRRRQECWLYVPGRDISPVGDHKTAGHGRVRVIPLTASAQGIILKRVKDFASNEPVFRPTDAIEELLGRRFAERQTPMYQGNRVGTNRRVHPMIKPRARYDAESLATAIKRACDRAEVPRFTPYDLRRTAATRTKARLDTEAAKLLLGHVSTDTTDLYLLNEVNEVIKVAVRLDQGG